MTVFTIVLDWNEKIKDTYKDDPLIQEIATRKLVNAEEWPDSSLTEGVLNIKRGQSLEYEGS